MHRKLILVELSKFSFSFTMCGGDMYCLLFVSLKCVKIFYVLLGSLPKSNVSPCSKLVSPQPHCPDWLCHSHAAAGPSSQA